MLYINPVLEPGGQTLDSPARRKMALQEFEQLYLREMLKSMRQTLPEGGLFEKSQQQQFFQEMLDDALAGKMAESGQFGLAAQIERQMDQQEAALKFRSTDAAGLSLTKANEGLPLQTRETKAGGMTPTFPATGLPLETETVPLNVQEMLQRADNQSVR